MTYTITTNTTSVTLSTPALLGHTITEKISNNLFPDGTDEQTDMGKSSDVLKFSGLITSDVYASAASINTMMDDKEIVTITGLPDSNLNTDYMIKSFNYKTQGGTVSMYSYDISLERMRDRL